MVHLTDRLSKINSLQKLEVHYIITDLWPKQYCRVALTMSKHTCVVAHLLTLILLNHRELSLGLNATNVNKNSYQFSVSHD